MRQLVNTTAGVDDLYDPEDALPVSEQIMNGPVEDQLYQLDSQNEVAHEAFNPQEEDLVKKLNNWPDLGGPGFAATARQPHAGSQGGLHLTWIASIIPSKTGIVLKGRSLESNTDSLSVRSILFKKIMASIRKLAPGAMVVPDSYYRRGLAKLAGNLIELRVTRESKP